MKTKESTAWLTVDRFENGYQVTSDATGTKIAVSLDIADDSPIWLPHRMIQSGQYGNTVQIELTYSAMYRLLECSSPFDLVKYIKPEEPQLQIVGKLENTKFKHKSERLIEALRDIPGVVKIDIKQTMQIRVNDTIDFYPKRQRFHRLSSGKRGSYTLSKLKHLIS